MRGKWHWTSPAKAVLQDTISAILVIPEPATGVLIAVGLLMRFRSGEWPHVSRSDYRPMAQRQDQRVQECDPNSFSAVAAVCNGFFPFALSLLLRLAPWTKWESTHS